MLSKHSGIEAGLFVVCLALINLFKMEIEWKMCIS